MCPYHEEVVADWCGRCVLFTGVIFHTLLAAPTYGPPAGLRPAQKRQGVSILPGGRVIAPLGEQHITGNGPGVLALSASGKTLVTANSDALRPSLTVLEHGPGWETRQLPATALRPGEASPSDEWHSVAGGLAFLGERSVFVSEGNTGRVALTDLTTGERRRAVDINQDGFPNSFTGDLVMDGPRAILYVADRAHARVAAIDTHSRQVIGSATVGGTPVALALSPDRVKLYVATVGSDTVSVMNVSQPSAPKVEATVRTESPGALVATAERVFVSSTERDSVVVIDARTHRVETEIPIRVPGLEGLRGVLPMGLAYDAKTRWLLVAEAGVNAVAIIDTQSQKVLGHLPAGWFPTRVLVDRGIVYVANQKGQGAGSNIRGNPELGGSVSIYPLPAAGELSASTEFVMQANGFVAFPNDPPELPAAIQHIVLIEKGTSTFDEVLGDVARASNGPAMGAPALARFGHDGYVDGRGERLSLHHLNVSPNHHAIAAQWAFSDNFYLDSDTNLSAFNHLAQHGVSFYQFGEDFNPEISDTDRAARLIRDINNKFDHAGASLPQFTFVQLPNDRMAKPRPEAGYPYRESYLADNDLALGRILEYLSGTKWWDSMVVFVKESSAEGIDHIDAHRTLLLCAGPWVRKNYVSHVNTGLPGLWKTIFRLLRVPSMSLPDATAADLSDCFAPRSDPAKYRALPVDPRVYSPSARPDSVARLVGAP